MGSTACTAGGQHDIFTIDERRAIDALKLTWGDFYEAFSVSYGGGFPLWTALSSDREHILLTGRTVDELERRIRADWQSRSQP